MKFQWFGIALVVSVFICVHAGVVNPVGIESGFAEVAPLSASATLVITWSDRGIAANPFFAMAIVEMETATSTFYRVIPTQQVISSVGATFTLQLSDGWVKLVYRWIVSVGEPLVSCMISLGSTSSGDISVQLPLGTPGFFSLTTIERIDTLLAGFDYANLDGSTGLDIQVKPIVTIKNVNFDDFTTDVDPSTGQLTAQPIATDLAGQMTLNVRVAVPATVALNRLVFSVILHSVVTTRLLDRSIVTGHAVPTTTQSAMIPILDSTKNLISVSDPESIYGANIISFANSLSGVGFKINLFQAQTLSVTFPLGATQLGMGVYMYANKSPCSGIKIFRTADLLIQSGIGSNPNNILNVISPDSFYMELVAQSGEVLIGFNVQISHVYELVFDLAIRKAGTLNSIIQVTIAGDSRTFSMVNDGIPFEPQQKTFSIVTSQDAAISPIAAISFIMTAVAGIPVNNMLVSNIRLVDRGIPVTGNPSDCYSSGSCQLYLNPFSTRPTPLIPTACRDCTPNPITGANGCNCPVAFYKDPVTQTCQPCQASFCERCDPSAPQQCSSCLYGRTLAGGQCGCLSGFAPSILGPCVSCRPMCETCDNVLSCLTCKTSDGGVTTNRNPTTINGECLCLEGFYEAGLAVCASCNSVCRTCIGSAGLCTDCKLNSHMNLQGNNCVCEPGFVAKIPQDGTCIRCDITCLTCSDPSSVGCVTCPSTRNLVSSAGSAACYCKPGLKETNPVDVDCVVGSCPLMAIGCIDCTVAGCTLCSQSLNYIPAPIAGKCQCVAGYFLKPPLGCVACSTACAICASAGVCSSCYSGATLSAGLCSCPDGTFPSAAVSACSPCRASGCSTCVSDICTSCKQPWVYANAVCLCPDQTYLSNGQCVNCPVGCRLCSESGCSSCLPNYFLLSGACLSACPDFFVGTAGVCLSCSANCKTCVSSALCSGCQPGFYLSAGACVSACPVGSFVSTNSICQPCSSPCSSCSGRSTFCTSCLPNSGYLIQGTCVPNCPDSTVAVGGVCTVCISSCATCFGSPSFCSSCPSPNYLFSGTCVLTCPVGSYLLGVECLSSCPTSTYSSAGACHDCLGSGCLTCTSSSVCTSCQQGRYLLGQTCVSQCPSNSI